MSRVFDITAAIDRYVKLDDEEGILQVVSRACKNRKEYELTDGELALIFNRAAQYFIMGAM